MIGVDNGVIDSDVFGLARFASSSPSSGTVPIREQPIPACQRTETVALANSTDATSNLRRTRRRNSHRSDFMFFLLEENYNPFVKRAGSSFQILFRPTNGVSKT